MHEVAPGQVGGDDGDHLPLGHAHLVLPHRPVVDQDRGHGASGQEAARTNLRPHRAIDLGLGPVHVVGVRHEVVAALGPAPDLETIKKCFSSKSQRRGRTGSLSVSEACLLFVFLGRTSGFSRDISIFKRVETVLGILDSWRTRQGHGLIKGIFNRQIWLESVMGIVFLLVPTSTECRAEACAYFPMFV